MKKTLLRQCPVLCSCSGCSDVAQRANEIAVRLGHHVRLYEKGLRKRRGRRYGEEDIEQVVDQVVTLINTLDH